MMDRLTCVVSVSWEHASRDASNIWGCLIGRAIHSRTFGVHPIA